MRRISNAIVCVGLAAVGAYMEIHGQKAVLVWIGAVVAFLFA